MNGTTYQQEIAANGFTVVESVFPRVIHIEFSDQELPAPLQWSELLHP